MRKLRENEIPYGYEEITLDMYNQIAAEIDTLFNSLIQIVKQAKEWTPSGVRGWLNNLIGSHSDNPYLREQFIASGSLEVYTECTGVVKGLVKFINENSTTTLSMGLIPALQQAREKIKANIKSILFNPRKVPHAGYISPEDKEKMNKWLDAWKYAKNKVRKSIPSSDPTKVEPSPTTRVDPSTPTRVNPSPTTRVDPSDFEEPDKSHEEPGEAPEAMEPEERHDDEEGYRSSPTAPSLSGSDFDDLDEIPLKDLSRNDNNFYALGHMAIATGTILGKNVEDVTIEDIQEQVNKGFFKVELFLPHEGDDHSSPKYISYVQNGKKLLGDKTKDIGDAETARVAKKKGKKRTPLDKLVDTILDKDTPEEEVIKAINSLALHANTKDDTGNRIMGTKLAKLIHDYLLQKGLSQLAYEFTVEYGHAKGKSNDIASHRFATFLKKFYEKHIVPAQQEKQEPDSNTVESVRYYKNLLKENRTRPALLIKESNYLKSLDNKDKIKYLVAKFRKIV